MTVPTLTIRLKQAAVWLVIAGMAGFTSFTTASAKEEESKPSAKPPAISEKTTDLEKRHGFLNFYADRNTGKIWLELPSSIAQPDGFRLLYAQGLLTGLGSNPVGLDRGLLGPTRFVSFRRVGEKILLEELNTNYRADTDNLAEMRAVEQSFATSVLWGGKIEARDQDGTVLVDFTPFLIRDGNGSARVLEATGQGTYTLDAARSAVDLESALVFPDNIELEALLTFAGKKPGPQVQQTAPTAHAVTLVEHHSFIRLPPDGYKRRAHDPRAGSFAISYQDYATPIDAPLTKKWIVRHRMEKTIPNAERSKVKNPITYYVDSGAPEPIRSALVEGASWWAEAFDKAGFIDAFNVKILPPGAHPLDVRYNVIQWVHRSTRGWSYGGGMIDPRTGEMLKGTVRLGSLRVRQDRLLFEGLAGTSKTGTGSKDDPVQLALARIRQLAAHEVGHALGLSHNFIASTYGRASVMDYPAPLVKILPGNSLDFSEAYAVGAGAWDIHAVRFAYTQVPEGADEAAELEKIIQEGIKQGYKFISDSDARPAGAAHPYANLWDNGTDPAAELDRLLDIRKIALSNFGESAVKKGRPLALLHEALVPVYFHHRYQLDAAAKVIGGLDYNYSLRGDGQPPAKMLDPAHQRRALASILRLMDPAELDLSEAVLEKLLPRPFGYWSNREMMQGRTSIVFDPLGAAETAASAAVASLIQPQRAARLIDFNRRDTSQPGLEEVISSMIDKGFSQPSPDTRRLVELAAVVRRSVVNGLLHLASDENAASMVRAQAEEGLRKVAGRLEGGGSASASFAAENRLMASEIDRFLTRESGYEPKPSKALPTPPGSPIGSGFMTLPEFAGCSYQAP
jgi:hypothetical protein